MVQRPATVAHAVAYSYQEARRILIAWGALRGIA